VVAPLVRKALVVLAVVVPVVRRRGLLGQRTQGQVVAVPGLPMWRFLARVAQGL